MKTGNLSTGAFILGALAASFAACSAQSNGTPPRNDGSGAGQTSSGGSGNAAAGASVIVGAGTTSTNPGAAGTFGSGAAGTFGTGAGGTFGTGAGGTVGTGTGGTVGTGTGGSAAMSCGTLTVSPADSACCVAAGTATDLSIDDLEDMNNVILPLGNRQGYWYSYHDTVGTTLMPSAAPFTVTTGGHGGMYSAGVSGMVVAATMSGTTTVPAYAGMGFDFNNHFKKSCPYGAGVYHGMTFWAKGTPFKVSIKIPATTPSTPLSAGSCATGCEDHYSKLVAPPPDGTSWGQITLMFTGDATFKQAGWGTVATFDPANILAVQFQIDGTTTQTGPVAYNYAVDDIAFLP